MKKISTYEKKVSKDVEPKPCSPMTFPSITLTRVSIPSPSAKKIKYVFIIINICFFIESIFRMNLNLNTKYADLKSRKLPKWMAGTTPSPVVKHTTTTPKSSYSRTSSHTAPTSAKRHCKLILYLTRTLKNYFFLHSKFRR